MLICLDCGAVFEEPKRYTEKHGLDTPPYEHFMGCPVCGGSYDDAIRCDKCGELVPDREAILYEGDTLCRKCMEQIENDE